MNFYLYTIYAMIIIILLFKMVYEIMWSVSHLLEIEKDLTLYSNLCDREIRLVQDRLKNISIELSNIYKSIESFKESQSFLAEKVFDLAQHKELFDTWMKKNGSQLGKN